MSETTHGISKQEAVDKLNAMGFRAIWDHGVVRVGCESNGNKYTVQEMWKIVNSIGYRMSLGFFQEGDQLSVLTQKQE